MKTTIQPQRAYITRRTDLDNSVYSNEEASRIAWNKGDEAEAKRRQNAADTLKRKHQRGERKPIDAGLIRELGPRDAISNMLVARKLEERHGMTALMLRIYESKVVVSSGGGNLVFIDGKTKPGMESLMDRLRAGHRAKQAADATLPAKEYGKPVHGLVCGHIILLQAARMIGGQTDRAKGRVTDALRVYLEAAEPYFGGG